MLPSDPKNPLLVLFAKDNDASRSLQALAKSAFGEPIQATSIDGETLGRSADELLDLLLFSIPAEAEAE